MKGRRGQILHLAVNKSKMSYPRAKEYFAALLVAQAGGKTIGFITTSNYIDQPLSDTLNYFSVEG